MSDDELKKKGQRRPIVRLAGTDGNPFAVIGLCARAARRAKWTPERWNEVRKRMLESDYNNLLRVALEEFEVR